MTDPYEVLGLDRRATEEEIKAAYHALVKKYHPDKYQDNPLADLAEEKLREVNEAYEYLMKTSSGSSTVYSGSNSAYGYGNYGGYSYGGNSAYGSSSSYTSSGSSEFYNVRFALDRDELAQAERLLAQSNNRTAEWYYLAGVLSYKKGYVDDGLVKIRQAISMAPNNDEYRNTFQRLTAGGAIYQTTSNTGGYSSDLCTRIIACYCCSSMVSPCW